MLQNGKHIRVVLAQAHSKILPALEDNLKKSEDIELFVVNDTPDNIWKQVITRSPNVTVFYSPEFGDAEKRCVNLILHGSHTHVLVITEENIESLSASEKLELHKIVKTKTRFDDIVSRVLELGGKEEAAVPIKNPLSSILDDSGFNTKILAIGASTGGTEALAKFFHLLPRKLPGIVVVQHMPPVFTKMYAERLNKELPFDVTEAQDNVLIKPGSIHIAPGDRHLMVKNRGGSFFTSVGGTEKVNGHCPSVDVLFESVADEAGKKAIGIILTGMGADGALGLLHMRQKGAYTIGQAESSCVVYGMPRKAFEYGAVVKQAELTDIPHILLAHLNG